jgi:hypothetical protein
MTTQKKTTRKLSGPSKDRFFDRFFGDDKELDEETAKRLSQRSKAVFTSVRVRKSEWPLQREMRRRVIAKSPAVSKSHKSPPAEPMPSPAPVTASTPPETQAPAAPSSEPAFDPFIFGLVPVFKREGAEGLRAKLDEILSVDDLRAMAKAQQIILPKDIRRGEVAVDTVRQAVLAAVEQRISDRKAQM